MRVKQVKRKTSLELKSKNTKIMIIDRIMFVYDTHTRQSNEEYNIKENEKYLQILAH